jgi:GPH family glycoside/pentoside/hexuronide:cation symporter
LSALPASPPARPRGEPIPLGALTAYSLPNLAFGYTFLLVSFYLMKFATDVLLIAPAAMGSIFMVARFWDALADPLAGYWSDRTQTRLGRRRPWMLASALPVAAGFTMLWVMPEGLGRGGQVAWMTVAVLGFYTAATVFIIPHTALGAELSTDYHERTRVFGLRQLAWNLGVFATLGAMFALTSSEAPRELAARLGVAAAGVTALLVVWSALRLRERNEYQGRGGKHPWAAFADVWRNPHARLLLLVFFIESIGGATVSVLTIYFSEYVVKTPALTTLYIAVYFVAASVSIPFWVPLSARTGKKQLWLGSMIATAAGFGATFWIGEGDWPSLVAVAALLGIAGGCGNVIAPSIEADVIDWDEHRTGERKEGAYFAAWNFVYKAATGITLGVTGFALQAAGFEPNAAQPEEARLAIRILYGIFPLVCYALGSLLFLRFQFSEREHAAVRAALDARNAGAP